jgi:1-deoxy-D-xylulose-5-phosphate synthase
MMAHALTLSGPAAVRYPKGTARQVDALAVGEGLTARKVRSGHAAKVCVIAVGHLLEAAEQAADVLRVEHGIDVTVWDPRVVVPADPDMLHDAATHQVVVTVEDGLRDGGVGSMMLDAVQQICLQEGRPAVSGICLGTPSRYIAQGKPSQILAELGLDTNGLVETISKAAAQRGLV